MKVHPFFKSKEFKSIQGVILFALILSASHLFWKLSITGEDTDNQVLFFHLDISLPFKVAAKHIAETSNFLLNLFNHPVKLLPNNILKNEAGKAIQVAWSCTGIKQAFIFVSIIAFYKGNKIHKLWYIPLGLLIIYIFNLTRITLIIGLIQHFPNAFNLLHEHLFKYLFYTIIFFMWVIWNERFCSTNQHDKAT